jgi:hypothetical protein
VQLNVAVVGAVQPGFVTVYPCGNARPNASSLNYAAGQIISNSVTVQPAADGTVCFYTHTAVDLVVDLEGHFPVDATYLPVVPTRMLETRSNPDYTTFDGLYQGTGAISGGTVLSLQIGGRGPVPVTAKAVQLNIAAIGGVLPGYVTVWSCNGIRPLAANLNFSPHQVVANSVTAELGPGANICIYVFSTVDIVVDLQGVY